MEIYYRVVFCVIESSVVFFEIQRVRGGVESWSFFSRNCGNNTQRIHGTGIFSLHLPLKIKNQPFMDRDSYTIVPWIRHGTYL